MQECVPQPQTTERVNEVAFAGVLLGFGVGGG